MSHTLTNLTEKIIDPIKIICIIYEIREKKYEEEGIQVILLRMLTKLIVHIIENHKVICIFSNDVN